MAKKSQVCYELEGRNKSPTVGSRKSKKPRTKCGHAQRDPPQACFSRQRKPSLSWLLPGTVGAQRRPPPKACKPLPPGIFPQRRLGIWRRLHDENGSARVIYVALDGQILQSPLSVTHSKQDNAVLTALGIKLQGPFSKIENPESTPPFCFISDCPDNLLIHWGIPQSVARAYRSVGVENIYPWQAQCLHLAFPRRKFGGIRMLTQKDPVPRWNSLVYCAPTSGGKSLVAEVIITRRLLYEGARALVVVPHVSLCSERVSYLRQVLGPVALRVEAFHSGANAASRWYPGVDVAVCTLEKANLILNKLIQEELLPQVVAAVSRAEDACQITVGTGEGSQSGVSGAAVSPNCALQGEVHLFKQANSCQCDWRTWWKRLCERFPLVGASNFSVGVVCVDELHFLGDPQRGHLMELLLSKIAVVNLIVENPIQIIGMSATLPNASEVLAHDPTTGSDNLRHVRRLHEGRLQIPSTADIAARAAESALNKFAENANASTEDGSGSNASHASILAAAIRDLRSMEGISQAQSALPSGSMPPDTATVSALRWQEDDDHLGELTWEVVREGRSAIVFCPTQEWSASTAQFLSRVLPFYRRREAWNKLIYQSFTRTDRRVRKHHCEESTKKLLSYSSCMLAQLFAQNAFLYTDPQTLQGRSELKWKLRQLSPVPSKVLEECISHGVAFHHAGLSAEERHHIETAYRRGYLRVLCATSTLALGVNLPAARVIIRAPHLGRDEMTPEKFRQMAGRAGRKGMEARCVIKYMSPQDASAMNRGDAYLICSKAELAKARILLSATTAANSTSDYRSTSLGTTKYTGVRVTSQLRGLNLCRFLLEVVHILLPLARVTPSIALRRNMGDNTSSCGPTVMEAQFCDAVAILLGCSLRGQQDSHRELVMEAAACVRYLHGIYLMEAELAPLKCDRDVPCKDSHTCSDVKDPTSVQSGTKCAVPGRNGMPDLPSTGITPDKTHFLEKKACTGCSGSLWRLSSSPQELPGVCQTLLQRYPCLRSPLVLCRFLQRALPETRAPSEMHYISSPSSPVSRFDQRKNSAATIPTETSRSKVVLSRHVADESKPEIVSFSDRVDLHFRGFRRLGEILQHSETSGGPCSHSLTPCALCGCSEEWRDVRGRLAVTEAGAAAVDAGIAPQDAAEIYADIFTGSTLGLCGETELHLLYIAGAPVAGTTQPSWRSYVTLYDKFDPPTRRAADAVGINRAFICSQATSAQYIRRFTSLSQTHELLIENRISFSQLRARVCCEIHRRFFFAMLLYRIYRNGDDYEKLFRIFGLPRNSVLGCVSQAALVAGSTASFLRNLRPQLASLGEACFMLAEKLKMSCMALGATLPIYAISSKAVASPNSSSDTEQGQDVLLDMMQLEGMTARRMAALYRARIMCLSDLASAPVYAVFKALEAAEPVELTSSKTAHDATPGGADPSIETTLRTQARLLSAAMKLKESAQQEQLRRIQELEDEIATDRGLCELLSEQ